MAVSWQRGEGRKGRKGEGTSGPLGNKKPRMANHTGREENEAISYRRTILARAERSIRRKQKRQRARKPKARSRGFMARRNNASVEPTRGDATPECLAREFADVRRHVVPIETPDCV